MKTCKLMAREMWYGALDRAAKGIADGNNLKVAALRYGILGGGYGGSVSV
jgi:hypothetical protein